MNWRISKLYVALGALLLFSGARPGISPCSAAMMLGDAVPLSNLLFDPEDPDNPDHMMTVGDKKFTQFTYSFTNEMPDASGVNVIPIKDDDGNFGIRFQGFFTDLASSQGGSDAFITYQVEATDPQRLISDAHLIGNLVLPDAAGFVGVTETFLPLGTGGEYTMSIVSDGVLEPKLADWVYFIPPVKSLQVQKDIGALTEAGSFPAMASFVDQTFSQIFVPEGTSMLLALTGLVTLVVLLRYGGVSRRRNVALCLATNEP